MSFHAFEDFEDEGLSAFVESASDDFVADELASEADEITISRPMSLRFAAEDADQLVIKVAQLRYNARLFAEDAREAMTEFLCVHAPEDADVLRALLREALETLDKAFDRAVLLEQFAVAALRDDRGDDFRFDPEEARLELCPPGPKAKVKLSPECQSLRRQFFAAATRVGLITKPIVRAARIAAVSGFVGHAIDATDELTQEEWLSCVYAVEDGRLQW